MRKKKPASVPNPTGLRFRSFEQRDIIQRAANEADTSMNSFIRTAAEKAARAVLAASESYKDSNKEVASATD